MEPAANHTRDHEQLAALHALDLLEAAELVEFEGHLRQCRFCQELVVLDRATLAELSAASPEREATPELRSRLLARAAQSLPSPTKQSDHGLARLFGRVAGPAWGFALGLLLLAFGIGATVGQMVYANQVLASADLDGQLGPGRATVVLRRSGAFELGLRDLPAPPPGLVYEAWVIPVSGDPRPAGISPTGRDVIPLAAPVLGHIVAITLEPAPGTQAPTSAPLLMGTVAL